MVRERNQSSDQELHFSTAHLIDDLKGRSIRGGAVTFLGQFLKFLLQLGSTVVLARILTPGDFGLIAMVAAITGFIALFNNLGLSMATIQKAEVNHDQISTLFWINVAFSVLLMLLTMIIAPLVAWFYKQPELKWVTVVLAIALIFSGLTVQHQALLRRQMRFVSLANIEVLSMAAGVITGIVLGLNAFGYWSLVAMQLVTAMVMTGGVWIASGWRPGIPVRHSGVRELLAFGGYLTGFNVVNYFARNLDNVLLGKLWGSHSVGIYSRAYSLLLLPIGQITAPITAVAIPALSRLQDDPVRFRSFYLKAIRSIAYITLPLVMAMAVLSTEIIGLVLGEQWLDAAPIFMILSFNAMWQPVATTVGWVYVSLGQTGRMFAWVCIAAPVIVASIIIGLPWGAVGVASGYTIAIIVLIIPQFSFALKNSPILVRDVALNLYRPLIVGLIVAVVMATIRSYFAGFGYTLTITICLIAGGSTFVLLALVVKPIRTEIKEIAGLGKSMFSRQA